MNRESRNSKNKKPFYKKWWVWVLAIVVIYILFGIFTPEEKIFLKLDKDTVTLNKDIEAKTSFDTNKGNKYKVFDYKTNKKLLSGTAKTGRVNLEIPMSGKYKIAVYTDDGQETSKRLTVRPLKLSVNELTNSKDSSNTTDTNNSTDNKTNSSVPAEYKSALTSAERYSSLLHMSQQAIYKQLTSESDKFSSESAQYAIDNMKADWNSNALESAKEYQAQLSMSPEAIREQLSSPDGGGFTQEQADYAIQHLND